MMVPVQAHPHPDQKMFTNTETFMNTYIYMEDICIIYIYIYIYIIYISIYIYIYYLCFVNATCRCVLVSKQDL